MKEQIEEMAKDLARNAFYYNGGCLMNYSNTAKLLYDAGYRKQREGEWIKHGYKWRCSNCGSKINIDGTPIENGLCYCSKCGAKMKGETNEKEY